jgi:hypothetical protein
MQAFVFCLYFLWGFKAVKNDMNTDIDKIKNKIKKLFALSKSPNANEAAAALEMAQKLMDEYGLIISVIPTLDVNEDEAPRASGNVPPQYEINLAVSIAEAFGCKVLMNRKLDMKELVYRNTYKFIGIDYRPEVASYIAIVLFRKLHRARAGYFKTLYRVRSRATKIKRGDEFSKGWVSIVIKKLKTYSGTPEENMVLEMYMKKYTDLETISEIDRGAVKKYEYCDWYKGREAGEGVEIQYGVENREPGVRLLGDN